ncbi:MAG: SsrA-binding protein SmpB [Candidatus Kapabacteria bacterium]|nr:SsrA-binding protein SmpB [Candidatus Kapabacteria bacterium]
MAAPADRPQKSIAKNRRAEHEYFVVQRIEAGIVLTGTEVKSLRAGKANLSDAYAHFPEKKTDTLILANLHISPYDHGNRENHAPLRPRTLLVSRQQAVKLRQQVQEKGLTLVPLSLYFSGPYAKVELAVVKGKKLHDKRESIKSRDAERSIRRMDE